MGYTGGGTLSPGRPRPRDALATIPASGLPHPPVLPVHFSSRSHPNDSHLRPRLRPVEVTTHRPERSANQALNFPATSAIYGGASQAR